MDEKKLLKQLLSNVKEENDKSLVTKAYEIADKYHGDARRKAGGKYIVHPLQVALIIAERFQYPDPILISVALLHDLVEDTELTIKDIEKEFGEEIANLVEGVTKIDKITFSRKNILNEENSKKLIRSVANDLKVMVIKLADRMNNLSTLKVFSLEKRRRIAKESIEFFSLFAKRLGIFAAYTEITDNSLLHIYGDRLRKLKKKIDTRLKEEEPLLKELLFSVRELLDEKNVKAQINFLEKGTHSFYDFEREQLIENIGTERSLYRIVVIVENKIDAYTVMGIVHSKFAPIRKSIVDMIATPKRNGFQSLFSHIKYQGKIFQFQFRTKTMDEIGHLGVIYYWKKYDYFSTPSYFTEFKEILLKLSEEGTHGIADSTLNLSEKAKLLSMLTIKPTICTKEIKSLTLPMR
ncbi:MAG: HD domain-containing protein [Nitrospinae bacterium]|nr:HD domain-containing protein [Nitrospinota bacterium]